MLADAASLVRGSSDTTFRFLHDEVKLLRQDVDDAPLLVILPLVHDRKAYGVAAQLITCPKVVVTDLPHMYALPEGMLLSCFGWISNLDKQSNLKQVIAAGLWPIPVTHPLVAQPRIAVFFAILVANSIDPP